MSSPEIGPGPSTEATAEASGSIDVTDKLRAAFGGDAEQWFAFDDELRALRRKPELTITLAWSELAPLENVQEVMRKLKAFVESGRGQRRSVTIRGTQADREAAAKIEPNVLASGVRWEYTDEA